MSVAEHFFSLLLFRLVEKTKSLGISKMQKTSKRANIPKFSTNYLGHCQASTMEFLPNVVNGLRAVNYFCKKAPS